MGRLDWCCFKFWLVWRFLLACLAHFNWGTAFYVNCIFFILWKSYDLLWFWMHLLLCICIPHLRPDNYLLVVCNLWWKKRKLYPNKTYQQIYKILYSRRHTKSERILNKMDKEDQGEQVADDDDASDDEQAMPTINVDRRPGPSKNVGWKPGLEKEGLLNTENGNSVPMRSLSPAQDNTSRLSDASSSKNGGWTHKLQLQKFIPSAFQRSVSRDSEDASIKTSNKQEKEEEKKRLKEEKNKQKEEEKRTRMARKEELRRLARIERREKTIAESIDLMLQCLRSVTSFAILVGNFHKTFLPRAYLSPDQDVYDNPDILILFTITLSLDVMLFWFSTFWTYWRQLRLMCRLGFCKFWLWLITLGVLGGLFMYYPMHMVHEQLDLSWCIFRPDVRFAVYGTERVRTQFTLLDKMKKFLQT